MILTNGNCGTLGDLHWYMVELRSEKTIETTLPRIGEALPGLFAESPIEMFIPIAKRDLNEFQLTTGSYIFVRSPNFAKLLRLKSITGVVGLATLGDSNQPSKAIKVDNKFVQEQIKRAEHEFLHRADSIHAGSFVRILDGHMRDWCGLVTELHDGIAVVRIEIKTKVLFVETPVRNLIDKSDVPEELRVFYYSNLVADLAVHGQKDLVAEDLSYIEDPVYMDDGLNVTPPTKLSRQQTVTALVKRLIVTGTLEPRVIAVEVLSALKAGKLKRPKNLSIVHGIIKARLIEDHFRKQDATIVNYREVVERFGPEWKFSLQELADIDPTIDLPRVTEEGEQA